MDDLNLHYRFLNWRRRIREIREVRAVRYQERSKHIMVDGDTLSYHGNSGEVGCYVAPRPLTKDNSYFEVSIVDSGVRGTIAVGLVPQYYSLDHQPGWLPDSVAYHADDGKLYNGRAKGRQFGTKCSSGDRIGCGIEPVSFEVQTAQIFFTKNGKRVGSTIMPISPDGLFPAVGMHSLGEEVRIHLNAELGNEEDDSVMMVDSYEDEWDRLHDVKVSGTLLEYIGKGKSIIDVGLAQARHPLSTRSHYFEVEIVDPGEKCYIALGLARKDYPKNRHPGWSRGSVAYHAGDSDDSCDTMEMKPKMRAVRNVLYLHQEEEEEEEEEEDGEEMEQEHEGKKVVLQGASPQFSVLRGAEKSVFDSLLYFLPQFSLKDSFFPRKLPTTQV
uniref:SPRY domain-containing protein 3 isoform X3 n=1 Tax=Geotrypetes seraphini TaxID=260995 RepID=A0A6P8QXP4_GEOSA|nr:SPRY domain-containing protein 3 isoform X3 [Geotrypetes seraphini]